MFSLRQFQSLVILPALAGSLWCSSLFASVDCAEFIVALGRTDADFLYAGVAEPEGRLQRSAYADYLQEQDDTLSQDRGKAAQFALTDPPPARSRPIRLFNYFSGRKSELDEWNERLAQLRQKALWTGDTTFNFEVENYRRGMGAQAFSGRAELVFHAGLPTEALVTFFEDGRALSKVETGWLIFRNRETQPAVAFLTDFLRNHREVSHVRDIRGDDLLKMFMDTRPETYVNLLRRGHPGLIADLRARANGLKPFGPGVARALESGIQADTFTQIHPSAKEALRDAIPKLIEQAGWKERSLLHDLHPLYFASVSPRFLAAAITRFPVLRKECVAELDRQYEAALERGGPTLAASVWSEFLKKADGDSTRNVLELLSVVQSYSNRGELRNLAEALELRARRENTWWWPPAF